MRSRRMAGVLAVLVSSLLPAFLAAAEAGECTLPIAAGELGTCNLTCPATGRAVAHVAARGVDATVNLRCFDPLTRLLCRGDGAIEDPDDTLNNQGLPSAEHTGLGCSGFSEGSFNGECECVGSGRPLMAARCSCFSAPGQ